MALSDGVNSFNYKIYCIINENVSNSKEVDELVKKLTPLLNTKSKEWQKHVLMEILHQIYDEDAYQLGLDLAERALVGKIVPDKKMKYELLSTVFEYIYDVCGGDLQNFMEVLEYRGHISRLPYY